MAKNSPIEWTDHTFNPWWGCQEVSPACDNCYARRDAKRYAPGKVLWGDGSTRRFFGPAHWKEPYRWARAAVSAPGGWPAAKERRPRVFCASMADVFDNHPEVEGERQKLWGVIEGTPELDWLLLTKRIGNAKRMLPPAWIEKPRDNVWLGSSIVTPEELHRDLDKLLDTPARIRFLSCEPLLAELNFAGIWVDHANPAMHENKLERLDWVIVGGESGPGARPMNPAWVRLLRDQCAALEVPFFFKQWGEWMPDAERPPQTDGVPVDWVDGVMMARVGKKRAGRTLDGRIHDAFPPALQVPA